MKTKIITTTDEFFKLKEDWERLQEQDDDVTYYSTFEYNWTWWDIYKNDKNKELFIVVVEQGRTAIGIAPLIIEKVNKIILSYRRICFLGKGDYLGIIIDRSSNIKCRVIIKEIFKFIESKNKYFERMTLTHINSNSRLSAYILKHRKYNKYFEYLVECPILNYKKYYTYYAYKNEFLTNTTQRCTSKLKKEVGYNLKVVHNNDEDVYEEISELHIKEQNYLKNRGRKERRSLYKDKFFSEFIKKIYNNNSNVITFKLEDINGNILTYNTCYLYKKILHSWNMAYNPEYEKYGLGNIHNFEVIKYIFENNITDIIDFGAGRYPWKFDLTDEFIFDYQLDMWNEKTLKGKVLKKMYNIKKKI